MGLDINIVAFDGFGPLDVFGPFEVFINTDGARVGLFSLVGPSVIVGGGCVRVEAVGSEEIDPRGFC